MKTILALLTLTTAFQAQAFSKVDAFECNGGSTRMPGSALVSIKTNPAADTLTLSVHQAVLNPPAINGLVLDITDVNPAMQYTIDAKKDNRPVDGLLVEAKLEISMESFAPTRTHPAVVTVTQTSPRGLVTTKSYNVTCQN